MARGTNGTSDTASVALDLSAYQIISFGGWFYVDSYPGSFPMFFEFTGDQLGAGGFGIYQFSGNIYVGCGGNVGGSQAVYSAPATGIWFHMIATYDFTLSVDEPNLYLNGVLQTPSSRPANANNTSVFANSTLYLAARSGSSLWGNVRYAELGLWGGVSLTADNASALADGHTPPQVRPDKLIGYWPMLGRNSPEIDVRRGLGFALTGTSNAVHPRVIYPAKSRRWTPAAVAFVPRDLAHTPQHQTIMAM